ncbi:ABC-type transport system, involved in lipoprotein release, permease component [Malonomonas rubra DSM 5091]|uniref:ABC-type transport system, involved in lipoprotein release, permease component n=1 Tax=Malonomonas rubra DSM 5091 TaxID=1122189 RepID=A0A1M6BV49_MALRU|nr:FtsX-like permease family protein [Malonomonas rubra]SHI52645.1 ABC-type transport system, involved in lipoprotein release, permease component [Malonomonas rubra DSM 5091]
MSFWLRFAFRSVLRRRRRTMITFAAVGFGIAMLIVLGAIMVGVNDTMVRNAVALRSGHLLIESSPVAMPDALAETEHWQTVVSQQERVTMLPRCSLSGVLKQGNQLRALKVQLVDPAAEFRQSPIPKNIKAGSWLKDQPGLVIGDQVATDLALEIGDIVQLETPQGDYRLPLLGTFHTGVQALDQTLGYLSLAVAELFTAEPAISVESALFADPGSDLSSLRNELQLAGGSSAQVFIWPEKLPEVEQLVKLNEFSMQVMILLVIAILAFGVANSLLISVMDRYRYFAILKAIGVRPRELVVTVIGEALVLCLGAGLLGTLMGIIVSLAWGEVGLDLSRYTSFNPHFSINPVIYPRLEPVMVLLPQGLALLAGCLAAFWPALVAARRTVSGGMRDL